MTPSDATALEYEAFARSATAAGLVQHPVEPFYRALAPIYNDALAAARYATTAGADVREAARSVFAAYREQLDAATA